MAKKLSPFEEAFAEARAKGEKTFPFNGKSYSTRTADDDQKKVSAMPSMSRTTGEVKASEGAKYSKEEAPKPRARSLVDQGRGVQLYKDVDKEAVLEAGLGLAALNPAVRGAKMAYTAARPAIGAAYRRLEKMSEDRPSPSFLREKDQPLFKSEKKSESSLFDDVSPRDFKKGGKVSGASKRGDGIAQRGRTKGRFI